jgi:hypothetical protein
LRIPKGVSIDHSKGYASNAPPILQSAKHVIPAKVSICRTSSLLSYRGEEVEAEKEMDQTKKSVDTV